MGESGVEVYIEKCRNNTSIPVYAREGDAGMDVCAAVDMELRPGQTRIIPTGLKMAIPQGYEIQVRPRSGLSYKTNLRIANSPGTIDSGYRDEIGVIMSNIGMNCEENNLEYTIDVSGNSEKLKLRRELPVYELSHPRLEESVNKPCVYRIRAGDRIAQIVLLQTPMIKFVLVDSVSGVGKDRGGGFGSSGVK